MRAIVKAKPTVGIEVMDMPKPKIRPDQVLLKVTGCGICGSDLQLYDWQPKARERRGKPIKLPVIIGHEPAGIIAEIGSDVKTSLKVGDRVASDSWGGCGDCYYCRLGKFNMCEDSSNIGSLTPGAYAEFVALPVFNLYKLPDSIPMDVAPMMQPLGVAMRAIEITDIKPGDTAAILGCGPIGLMEAMVVRSAGVAKIWVTGMGADKKRLELAKKMGFEAVNIEEQSIVDIVKEGTGGLGVDVVFDATVDGAGEERIKILKKAGQFTMTSESELPLTFDSKELNRKREITIRFNRGRNPSTMYRAVNLLASGRIDLKPLITEMPLEKGDEAFQMLKKRQAMKVVIIP